MKLYSVRIWMVSNIVNSHDEFKYGEDNEDCFIKWKEIFPSYVNFHKEGLLFQICNAIVQRFFEFYCRAMDDREKPRNIRGIVENKPPNFLMFPVCCG